ncbi:hypothetical protein SBA4_720008 [Candidatus Sulfopaludibacter sp. SbA4]|nr:hypothetical protein SBA4_720008 [Candidatus Sulfopaludibacter sp. SbA4]
MAVIGVNSDAWASQSRKSRRDSPRTSAPSVLSGLGFLLVFSWFSPRLPPRAQRLRVEMEACALRNMVGSVAWVHYNGVKVLYFCANRV